MQKVMIEISHWAVPLAVLGIVGYGVVRKVRVYEAFVEGAKEGWEVAVRIIPYLVAILSVIGAFRSSGAMEAVTRSVGPWTERIGLPAAELPLMIIRPLSGGAARGVVVDIFEKFGADSYTGRLASVMSGCTETTFYVLAVYAGAVGISRYRQALPAALLADLSGFTAALVVTLLVFGR